MAEHAGVDLGRFHDHFKTKDVFVAAVLQQRYEGMFANLVLESHRSQLPVENLRAALIVMACSGRDLPALLVWLFVDGFGGRDCRIAVLSANMGLKMNHYVEYSRYFGKCLNVLLCDFAVYFLT